MEDNQKKKDRKLSKEDIERLELLHQADQVTGQQLSINLDSELVTQNQADQLINATIDDPVQKFQLYYNGLNKLLKDNLPKGKENKDIRQFIYDEKNILINRGAVKNEKGIRGSDGRMAYLEDLEVAIKIVADWTRKKGSPVELYQAFWDKNEELGYGHQN